MSKPKTMEMTCKFFINKDKQQNNEQQQAKLNIRIIILILKMNRSTHSQTLVAKKVAKQEAKREGDWVCLFCNNLNYSFRDHCNRCKTVTKQLNKQLAQKAKILQHHDREPLQQIYLTKQSSVELKVYNPEHIIKAEVLQQNRFVEGKCQKFNNLHPSNNGFSSLLYLTPTRYKDNCSEDDYADYYKSPKLLPSISPLLRSLRF